MGHMTGAAAPPGAGIGAVLGCAVGWFSWALCSESDCKHQADLDLEYAVKNRETQYGNPCRAAILEGP